MEINYELKFMDHFDSAFLASKSRRGVFIFDIFVSGCLVVTGVLCFVFGVLYLTLGRLGFSLGFFLLVGLLWYVFRFYIAKRLYGWKMMLLPKGMVHEKETVTVRFHEEALEYQNSATHLHTKWKAISHYTENEKYFVVIFQTQKLIWTIPKRAFADDQQINDARRYFAKIKDATPAVPPIAQPY